MPRYQLIFRYDDGREVTQTGDSSGTDDLPPRALDGAPLWPGETFVARGERWSVEFEGEQDGMASWICRPC